MRSIYIKANKCKFQNYFWHLFPYLLIFHYLVCLSYSLFVILTRQLMKFLTPLSFYFLLLCVVFTSFFHNWSVIIHQTALHSTHHPPYVVLQFHSVMSYVTCTYLGKNINIHTTFISNSHLLYAYFQWSFNVIV